MKQKYLKKFLKYFDNIKSSFVRFPETALVVTLIAIIAIIFNHDIELLSDLQYKNILLTLNLALPGSTFARLYYENYKESISKRVLINAIFALLLIIFYIMIPEDKSSTFMIRFSFLLIISYSIFLLIPYGYKKRNFSIYILRLMTNFLIVFLFSLVLYLGIILILFTIDKLFDLYIDSKLYFDIFIMISGMFFSMSFLGRLPQGSIELKKSDYPNVIRLLISYIVIPILVVYTVVLYLYFIKIGVNKKFDINLLNNLTIWYGIISIITLFFIHPIKNGKKQFFKFFPISMILPVVVLSFSIGNRILNYGITPPRFFVIIIIIWLVYSILYTIIRKENPVQLILLAGIALMFISIYSPKNAFNISFNSQERRFKNILIQNEMLVDEKLVKKQEINDQDKKEISSFISYFKKYGQLEKLNFIPKDFEYKDMEEVFGFSYISLPLRDNNFIRYYHDNKDSVTNIKGYDYMVKMNLEYSFNIKIGKDIVIVLKNDNQLLSIKSNEDLLIKVSIKDLVKEIHDNQNNQNFKDYEEATFIKENEKIKLAFVIENLFLNSKKIDSDETDLVFDLLIKIK